MKDLKQLSQIKTHKETKYRPNIYEGALCSFAPREKYAMQENSIYLAKLKKERDSGLNIGDKEVVPASS